MSAPNLFTFTNGVYCKARAQPKASKAHDFGLKKRDLSFLR